METTKWGILSFLTKWRSLLEEVLLATRLDYREFFIFCHKKRARLARAHTNLFPTLKQGPLENPHINLDGRAGNF